MPKLEYRWNEKLGHQFVLTNNGDVFVISNKGYAPPIQFVYSWLVESLCPDFPALLEAFNDQSMDAFEKEAFQLYPIIAEWPKEPYE